jgi:hypothetical protein
VKAQALQALPPADDQVNKPRIKIGGFLPQIAGGSTKIAAQVRSLLGVFNPAYVGLETRLKMRNDPTVSFALAVLRAPVVNLQWSVQSQDSKIAAFVDQELRRVYFELATGASLAIAFGFQPMEKIWRVGPVKVEVDDKSDGTRQSFTLDSAWTYERFKALDPKTVHLLIDDVNDTWGGLQGTDNAGKPIRVGVERSLLWSFRSEQVWGKLTGYPVLDPMYEPWWWKSACNLFCNRYFERKAEPSYKAHAPAEIIGPNGEKLDGFAFMQNVLMGLKNGEAVTLPGEYDEKGNRIVDVELLQDDKRGDMFQQRLEYLDLQIMKAALIADRAGSAGRGSGIGTGEAAVHFDILQMLLEEILQEWLRVVQSQVIDPLVRYNFGEEAVTSSRTIIKSPGLSQWMRDLYRVLMQQLLQAEVALKDGKVVKVLEYLDAIKIAEALHIPIKSADELGPLAHDRVEQVPPDGPIGNPGDVNVKGKQGRKPAKP